MHTRTTNYSNGQLLFTLIGTALCIAAPVVTSVDGLFTGGITLLAGVCLCVFWRPDTLV
jgi:hypothetical protein